MEHVELYKLFWALFLGILSIVDTANSNCSIWDEFIRCKDIKPSDYPLKLPPSNGTFTLILINTGNLPDFAIREIQIEKLEIRDSNITNISENAFVGHEDTLKSLHISTVAKQIPAPIQLLENLHNLEELKITGFILNRTFNHMNFANLSQLQSLHVESNNLLYFEKDVFKGLSTLTNLTIKNNLFSYIPLPNVFKDLPNLAYLDMSDNKIEKITGYNLQMSKKLKYLILVKNGLAEIEKDAFKGLEKSLKVLNLKLNILKHTQLMNMSDALSLTTLNLQSNRIQVLPDGLFRVFNSLQVLNLKDNKLSKIKKGDLQGLISLKTLQLDFNNLTVETGTLLDTPQLQEIYFKKQKRKSLDMEWVQDVGTSLLKLYLNDNSLNETSLWLAIQSLLNLKYLSLSGCNLEFIPDFAFEQNRHMQTLKLAKNRLQVLKQETFQGLQESLISLDLSSNNLQTIDECVFQQFNFSLQQETFPINLDSNSLVCNCSLLWLQEQIQVYLTNLFTPVRYWRCAESTKFIYQANITCDSNSINQTCQNFSDRYTTVAPTITITMTTTSTETPISYTSSTATKTTKENTFLMSTLDTASPTLPATMLPSTLPTTLLSTTLPSTTLPSTTLPSTLPSTTLPSTTQTPVIPILFLHLEKLSSSSISITWNISSWGHVKSLVLLIHKTIENFDRIKDTIFLSQEDSTTKILSNLKIGTILNVCIRLEVDFPSKLIDLCKIIRLIKPTEEANKNSGTNNGTYIGIGVAAAVLIMLLLSIVGLMRYSRRKSKSSFNEHNPEPSMTRPKLTQRSKRYEKRKNPSTDPQVSVISVEPFQPIPRISAGSYQYLVDPNLMSSSIQQPQSPQPASYDNGAFSESGPTVPIQIERNNNQRISTTAKRPLPSIPRDGNLIPFQPEEPIYVNVQPHYAEIQNTETQI